MSYLDNEEVSVILKQPNLGKLEGQRDHALLSFLYNTGARIQEALNICPRDIRFSTPAQVRLHHARLRVLRIRIQAPAVPVGYEGLAARWPHQVSHDHQGWHRGSAEALIGLFTGANTGKMVVQLAAE